MYEENKLFKGKAGIFYSEYLINKEELNELKIKVRFNKSLQKRIDCLEKDITIFLSALNREQLIYILKITLNIT